MLSDTHANIGGSLSGLAAMAGINLDGSGSTAEIHPTLYPKIVESYSFQKKLMQTPIYVSVLGKEVTFKEYYTKIHQPTIFEYIKKYTIGLPIMLMNSLNEQSVYDMQLEFDQISACEKKIIKLIQEQVVILIDEKDGFVKMKATMPESVQAAQLVEAASQILQRQVLNHKLKKINDDLLFINGRYLEKKTAFEVAQDVLAKYRDANRNVNTAIAHTELELLESEYELAFAVYKELAKQLEKQKIQAKENTPVFIVLQEAVIPFDKTGLSKKTVVLLWLIIGVFVGVVRLFTIKLLSNRD